MSRLLDFSIFSHYQTIYSSICTSVEDAPSMRRLLKWHSVHFTECTKGWWIWRRVEFVTECPFDELRDLRRIVRMWGRQ